MCPDGLLSWPAHHPSSSKFIHVLPTATFPVPTSRDDICSMVCSAFSKRALHSNVPSNLVPSTFLKLFRGERGGPWYGPSAPPGRHFTIRTLGYKRAFGAGTRYASLGLFLGILGATGRDQGGTWYGTSAKPARHFTKGMFGKP